MSTAQEPIPLITPVKYGITCRICRQRFEGPPFKPLMTPGVPDDRMNKIGKKLWDHVTRDHAEFAPMALIVSSFAFEDPVLLQFTAPFRYLVLQSVRRAWVSDEKIHETLSRISTPEDYEAAFKDLRDLLTETGKYGPQLPGQPQ